MAKLAVALVSLALVWCWGGQEGLAYSCPVEIKQAEELIAKAERGERSPEGAALLDEAKKLVAEAKASHEGARSEQDHADAITKAKTAQTLAEQVAALAGE